MIILHSWGGCRKLLLRGSSCLAQNQRSSQGSHVHLARLSAGSIIIFPWLRQELLSPPVLKPGPADALGMLLVLPCSRRGEEPLHGLLQGCSHPRLESPVATKAFFSPRLVIPNSALKSPDS